MRRVGVPIDASKEAQLLAEPKGALHHQLPARRPLWQLARICADERTADAPERRRVEGGRQQRKVTVDKGDPVLCANAEADQRPQQPTTQHGQLEVARWTHASLVNNELLNQKTAHIPWDEDVIVPCAAGAHERLELSHHICQIEGHAAAVDTSAVLHHNDAVRVASANRLDDPAPRQLRCDGKQLRRRGQREKQPRLRDIARLAPPTLRQLVHGGEGQRAARRCNEAILRVTSQLASRLVPRCHVLIPSLLPLDQLAPYKLIVAAAVRWRRRHPRPRNLRSGEACVLENGVQLVQRSKCTSVRLELQKAA